ncbi:DUF6452 family protein [Winogradskyella luteola]|uniref:Lipoprotein n=1 Tax=Winogradskyella luteola TaxID=2828330 RepID=A0A9X1FB22_9FLAO|nr:DUF6452 family protein [Winogradskyella luteola]MBV7270336.1 hypothetical protein [Winogradskyella luteola]
MKRKQFLLLFMFLAIFSCERDDICAESTSTTPRLIIEFYDVDSPEDLKNVPRISVYGEELFVDENGVFTPPTESSDSIVEYDGTVLFDVNSNTIGLPLLIGTEGDDVTTRFLLEKDTNLRIDDDPTATSNLDIIEISYIPQFEYVSRACGYKSIFTELDITIDSDGDDWIDDIEIDVVNIENENTVHVRIFH